MSPRYLGGIGVIVCSLYVLVGLLFIDLGKAEMQPIQTPQDYLREQCEIIGCDYELLNAIATCESQWRMVPNAVSSSYGYFQILDSTERETPQYQEGRRKFDPYTNIDMGIYLFERYGSSPWNESRGCWYWRYQSL
jgi:hypothetical protein